MGIKKSLAIGGVAEQCFMAKLTECGLIFEKSSGKQSCWDIKVDFPDVLSGTFFAEIKFDKMSAKTGNLAIEFFNPKSNKISGISVTTSDFWVYAFGNPLELWVAQVNELKRYINDNAPFKTIDVGGDNNASLFLYKKDVLLRDIFTRIDNMGIEHLRLFFQLYINERNYVELVQKAEA